MHSFKTKKLYLCRMLHAFPLLCASSGFSSLSLISSLCFCWVSDQILIGLTVTKEFVELPSTLIHYPHFFLLIYEANCFLILFLLSWWSLSTLPFTSLYWHEFNLFNCFYCWDNFEFKSCPPAYLYLLPTSGDCAISSHSLPLCLTIYGITKYL